MPKFPIFEIHIFSDSYEITEFLSVQKVTNVVKKYVKKWSFYGKMGSGITGRFHGVMLVGSGFKDSEVLAIVIVDARY